MNHNKNSNNNIFTQIKIAHKKKVSKPKALQSNQSMHFILMLFYLNNNCFDIAIKTVENKRTNERINGHITTSIGGKREKNGERERKESKIM